MLAQKLKKTENPSSLFALFALTLSTEATELNTEGEQAVTKVRQIVLDEGGDLCIGEGVDLGIGWLGDGGGAGGKSNLPPGHS